ncbi:MAG TPA: hypothetical protein PKY58_12635 [Syntrophales bacterium]|nr:hypothetical protein [Syntrophales bacterium]HQB31388.1 hypothetical protein [Syntrophales bacterium]HQN79175.1 hypothetical protein [Syntrophales bacterium]HQQ28364.1 hypothetical protein [Syntrophales bacterium]
MSTVSMRMSRPSGSSAATECRGWKKNAVMVKNEIANANNRIPCCMIMSPFFFSPVISHGGPPENLIGI